MGKETFYNYNSSSPAQVTRELYNTVGNGDNFVGNYPRAVKSSTDFEIWDSVSGGIQLTEGVDYQLRNLDKVLRAKSGFDVYAGYKILNVTYQTGNIYITYKVVQSYNDAEIQNDLRSDVDQNISDIAVLQANPALPVGYISKLEMSNDSGDTEHDINFLPGRGKDSTGALDLILPSEMTKRIDDVWAAGDDNGGLFSGASLTADTFYYPYIIRKDSDGSIDMGFDDNKIGTNVPAGYTYFRKSRGAVLTNGSANILGFTQKDDYFFWNTIPNDYLNLNPGTTNRILATVSAPPDTIAQVRLGILGGAVYYAWLRSTFATDDVPTISNCDQRTSNDMESTTKLLLVDGSSQVAFRLTNSAVDTYIFTDFFIDPAQS